MTKETWVAEFCFAEPFDNEIEQRFESYKLAKAWIEERIEKGKDMIYHGSMVWRIMKLIEVGRKKIGDGK